jgi:hypothetical protein
MYTAETDSLGQFTFSLNNLFADELNVLIQSNTKKGKPRNFNIILDDPLTPPKVDYKPQEAITLADTIYNAFIEESIIQYETNNDFKTSSETVALDAVELTGYNVTPEREKIFKLHGPPDIVIENEDLVEEEEDWMSGLYDLLFFKFRDDIFMETVTYSGRTFEKAYVYGTDLTLFYIDGEVVLGRDYLLLPSLPVENIKSVEILRRPDGTFMNHLMEAFPRMSPEQRQLLAASYIGVVSIYTYGGNGIGSLSTPKGIFQGTVSGFSAKREFYAPKYDKLQDEDWNIPDVRSVVHWQPIIQTDKSGLGQIEFYNGDNTGDMLVIVEAITPDGKIGYFETTYKVEEKLEK